MNLLDALNWFKKNSLLPEKALKGAKVSNFRWSGSVTKFHGSATLVKRTPYLTRGPRTKTRANISKTRTKIVNLRTFKNLMPPFLSFATKNDQTHLSWSQLWAGSRGEWRSGGYLGHSHPLAGQGTEKETQRVRLYEKSSVADPGCLSRILIF